MDRFVRYAALFLNVVFIAFALMVFAQRYDAAERAFALSSLLLPFFNICALRRGPDAEEMRLIRQVRKARLRDELAKLTK